jgi:hypothetical protein
MADINSIAAGSIYRGDKELGGYIPDGFEIDMKPVEKLAAYTFLQNQAYYNQRQQDADAAIKELADISQFDAANSLPQYRDEGTRIGTELVKEAAELTKKIPRTPQERVQLQYDLQRLKRDKEEQVKALNAKNISYKNQLASIDKSPIAENEKQILRDRLTGLFKDVKWNDPTPTLPNYSVKLPEVGVGAVTKLETNVKDANGVYHIKLDEVFNPKVTNQQSLVQAEGLEDILPANASEDAKVEYALRKLKGGSKALWDKMSENYNAVVNSERYKVTDENGNVTVNVELMKSENPEIATLLEGVDKWNEYNRIGKENANKGLFASKGVNVLTADDFFEIDKTKPISANNLLNIQKFLRAKSPTKAEEYNFTGESLKQQDLAKDWFIAKTGRGQLQLEKDKWNTAQTGGETVKNGAWEFATSMYKDLAKLADKNGVINPDELRKLNAEQLKYLGVESGETSGIFNPLQFTSPQTAIQLVNGEIRVLDNATKLPDGRYEGTFNNTKSTNVRNVATNRLNEELKNAGSKEVNTYVGIDVSQSGTEDVYGGSTRQSGGSSTSTPLTGKVDPATLQVGQSYSVNGKTYIWDGKKLKAQ